MPSFASSFLAFVFCCSPFLSFGQDGWYISPSISTNTVLKPAANGTAGLASLETSLRQGIAGISRISAFPVLEKGHLVMEADIPDWRKGDTSTILFYIQGRNKQNASVAFRNGEIQTMLLPGEKGTIRLSVPFRQSVDSVRVGIYLKGDVSLRITNLRFGPEPENREGGMHAGKRLASDPALVADLALLARVWGFLKYFSPVISDKNIDWDHVLVPQLEQMLQHPGTDVRTIIRALLDTVAAPAIAASGRPGAKRLRSAAKVEKVNVDHSWIDGAVKLSAEDKARLHALADGYHPFKNKYVDPPGASGKPSPVFNEKTYSQEPLPERAYRLLALFRYWNIIEYFLPAKHQLQDPWPATLAAMIPLFADADEYRDYARALLRLNAAIKDGHCIVPGWTQFSDLVLSGKKTWLPFQLGFVGDTVFIKKIDSAFATASGIRPGDVINSLNGVPVAAYTDSLKAMMSETRDDMKAYYLTYGSLLRHIPVKGDSLSVGFTGSSGPQTVTVPYGRQEVAAVMKALSAPQPPAAPSPAMKMLDGDILYIDPSKWTGRMADTTRQLLGQAKSLMIECRTYPNFDFINFTHFLFKRKTTCIRWNQVTDYPGLLHSAPYYRFKDHSLYFKGKVVALVSEASISRPEMLAMIIQGREENRVLIGRRTGGADGDITQIPMIGNQDMRFVFTGLGVLYPDFRITQGVGLAPDIEVPNSRREMMGEDVILQHALHYLSSQP